VKGVVSMSDELKLKLYPEDVEPGGFELKLCPFCGYKAEIQMFKHTNLNNETDYYYYVECSNCGARTQTASRDGCKGRSPQELVATVWNQRMQTERTVDSLIKMNEEDILTYLDAAIEKWRHHRDNPNSAGHKDNDLSRFAEYYIDAFQSIRSSLFGKTKE